MSNIRIFSDHGVVVVELNGERTIIRNYKKYTNFDVMERFARGRSARYLHKGDDIKQAYIKAGDIFGCSVARVTHMLNGAINRVFVNPNYDMVKRFCFTKFAMDAYMVNSIVKNRPIIDEYIADGNTHLAGFAMILGDAYKAKKCCGKGFWKSLRNNSKSRNDTIVRIFIKLNFHKFNNIVNILKFLQAIPSSLLKFNAIGNYYQLGPVFASNLAKHLNKPMCKATSNDVIRLCDIFADCQRMLGDRFNPNWSGIRVVKEHDKEQKRLNALKYTDDNFPYYDLLPKSIESDGFCATLIRSPHQLRNLGESQHHCVGTYSYTCWDGKYTVYSITDKEGLISVIGFNIGESKFGDRLHNIGSQHYHACNSAVSDLNRSNFGNKLKEQVSKVATSLINCGKWINKGELRLS